MAYSRVLLPKHGITHSLPKSFQQQQQQQKTMFFNADPLGITDEENIFGQRKSPWGDWLCL